jgi:hypothetical protein
LVPGAVTRSCAYTKNDQAFVEQKNGAVVRRLVGYGRFEGVEAAQAMARLYAAARLYVNFFQPSFKLKEKRREDAKVIKRYHDPATPFERALAHPKVTRGQGGWPAGRLDRDVDRHREIAFDALGTARAPLSGHRTAPRGAQLRCI